MSDPEQPAVLIYLLAAGGGLLAVAVATLVFAPLFALAFVLGGA